jgi:hypothetical protein
MYRKMKDRVKTSLYLDKRLYRKFCELAKKQRRSASQQLEQLMEEALDVRVSSKKPAKKD